MGARCLHSQRGAWDHRTGLWRRRGQGYVLSRQSTARTCLGPSERVSHVASRTWGSVYLSCRPFLGRHFRFRDGAELTVFKDDSWDGDGSGSECVLDCRVESALKRKSHVSLVKSSSWWKSARVETSFFFFILLGRAWVTRTSLSRGLGLTYRQTTDVIGHCGQPTRVSLTESTAQPYIQGRFRLLCRTDNLASLHRLLPLDFVSSVVRLVHVYRLQETR